MAMLIVQKNLLTISSWILSINPQMRKNYKMDTRMNPSLTLLTLNN